MGKKILVVAAHPDDEVLGCGGTIARHAASGDQVHILLLAEGITSRKSGGEKEDLSELGKAAKKACASLKAHSLEMLQFPDNSMDTVPLLDVVQAIEKKIESLQPQVVYTHHNGDVNIDHRVIHEAVIAACRPIPGNPVETLLFFEVASSTEWQPPGSAPAFQPNWFVDISATLPQKLKALEDYAMEMRPWPHTRSLKAVEHLAHWRGASIGVEAAEAFILGRNKV